MVLAVAARGLAGRALGALASCPGLLAELALEVGQPLLDVGAGRRGWGGGRDRGAAPQARDLPVGLLDLLEPPRGLDRAAVVVGMVQLDEPPVGGPKLLVGDARLDPEDGVGVAAQELRPRDAAAARSGGRRASGRTRYERAAVSDWP